MAIKETKVDETDEGIESTKETENESDESSALEQSDPITDRLKSFESQLERQRQENEALRESVRLQSRLLEQQNQGNRKSDLSPELEELNKAIAPLMGQNIQQNLQPIIGTVSQLYDQNDAVAFQLQLQRENPELLTEENFTKISQAVEVIRQRASREGTWLKREDAYKYAKGDGQLKSILGKKGSKQKVDDEEVLRKKQIAATQGTVGNSAERTTPGAYSNEVAKIRDKASAGIRLTPEERTKWRDSMGDVAF